MTEAVATATSAAAGGAFTLAAVYAGLPLGMGFAAMGVLGAFTGHMRWMIERERKTPDAPSVSMRKHFCMLLRAVLMAEFVATVLLLVWIDQSWPWAWGLIFCAISSVFAPDAIELMWQAVQERFKRFTGITSTTSKETEP